MGFKIIASCKKCTYEKNFMLGQGYQDYKIEAIIKYFQGDDKNKIRSLIEKNDIDRFLFNIYLTSCDSCRTINETPIIKIQTKSCISICIGDSCKSCKKKLRILSQNNEITQVPCPNCGGILTIQNIGFWD